MRTRMGVAKLSIIVGTLVIYLQLLSTKAGCRNDSGKSRRTAEEMLIKELFCDYDTDARSVHNTSATVTVQVQFLLLRIQSLDEKSQIFMTTGLILTDWTDERLTWEPEDHNNITDVVVRAERIWTPELAVINGANDMIQDFERIRVLIRANGSVHWEPGGVFVTTCDIDITFFPFDTQACKIEIGAWAYKSSRMNLSNTGDTIEQDQFSMNGEWDIINTTAIWDDIILPNYPDISYSKVVFTIYMNRRYTFYVVNIILPCALLSVLILIVFCVPPDAGEKISAGISVLLAFTVFLLMLADNVPRTSLNTPILVIYLASTMALGTASVCLTVVVLHLHHRGSHTAIPNWARSLFLIKISRLLCIPEVYDSPYLKQPRLRPNNVRHYDMTCGNDVNDINEIERLYDPPRHMTLSESNLMTEAILQEAMHYHNVQKQPRKRHARRQEAPPLITRKDESIIAKEWQLLAKVVDRIFFCLVFIIMFTSASFILLSPWYSKNSIYP